jgi:hypothetical protein
LLLPAAPFLFGDIMTALVTLDDYKRYKKITKTDNDEEIGFIIDSVSSMVKSYCGHSFIDYYTTPIEEIFNINNMTQNAIQLNEWPVKAISTIYTRQAYNTDYVLMDSANYYTDPMTGSIYLINGDYWYSGFASVKVTYTAGWATTPDDIKIACLDLVHHYYKEEYKERKQIGNVSVDNSNRYIGIASKWPAHVSRVLHMYKNV